MLARPHRLVTTIIIAIIEPLDIIIIFSCCCSCSRGTCWLPDLVCTPLPPTLWLFSLVGLSFTNDKMDSEDEASGNEKDEAIDGSESDELPYMLDEVMREV